MRTKIIKTKGDWNEVLNDCRFTVGKKELEKEPSENFKKNILIAEHSPIRDISIKWVWENIPHWVGVHWVRHKWECFVRTQRTDRTGVDRNSLRQDELQNFTGEANVQNLIDTMRKRLCYQASPETRRRAEDLKKTIGDEYSKEIADVLVPNCVYRCGCPEKTGEECKFFENLKLNYGEDVTSTDIQKRYDVYNKFFDDYWEKSKSFWEGSKVKW